MKTMVCFFSLIATLLLFSCNNEESNKANYDVITKDSARFTSIVWLDSIQDFGKINQGEKVKVIFKCKNTGKYPLYILKAMPSCGCTVADYTKKQIKPNEEGFVSAIFDSNKSHGGGDIRKTIIVNTNTINSPEMYLVFNGFVINAPNDKVVIPKEKIEK